MTSFLNHELKIKSYTVLVTQRLAQGGFGYVDLAIDVRSRREVVLKRCSIQRQESFTIVNKEIRILQQFKGPYIVELIAEDIITNNGKQEAILLLELCPGGHLLQRLLECSNTKSYFNQNEIYKIFGQICSAVKSLHDNTPPITHRDLKLENILFGSDGNVRLCDFGSCVVGYIPLTNVSERSAAEEIISKETTQMYRAPELIDLYMRNILTEKTDIWALGCIFYAINFLKHPFQDLGGLGILSCNIAYPNDPPTPEESKILMKRMLDIDPEARPSIGQIIDAITALLRNEPLPHYELSEEAIKKRQERLDREAHKAAKRDQKKKGKDIITPKRNAHLDSNSVAARRLAAAKGLPVNSENLNHNHDSNHLVSIDENVVFTDFGSFNINETNHAMPPQQQPQQQQHQQPQQQQQQQQLFDGFDAFSNNDTFSNQSSNDFSSFDAFTTSSSSTVENFTSFPDNQFVPSSSNSNNTFDLFQDDVQPTFPDNQFAPTSLFGSFPNDTAAVPVSSTTSSPRGSFTQLPAPSSSTSPRNSFTSTANEDFLEFPPNPPSALQGLFGAVAPNDNNITAHATPRNSFTSTQSLIPSRGIIINCYYYLFTNLNY